MKVTKVTEARLYTGAGLHGQVETKDDLHGGWGIKMQKTYHRKQKCILWLEMCSFVHLFIQSCFFKQMYLELSECCT